MPKPNPKPKSNQAPLRIFIIAGESSGDALGGALMADLKALSTRGLIFAGLGGAAMQAQGLKPLFSISDLAIMGLAEVLPQLPTLLARLSDTANALIQFRPDVIITIDSPDFCLRVLRRVRRHTRAPVVHYVAPSVWAWRPKRAVKMARVVDHVLALLPFEPPYMWAAGMSCDFVGHPAVRGEAVGAGVVSRLKREWGVAGAPVICLLPGSRRGEVRRLLPIFGEVAERVAQTHPNAQFILPVATDSLTDYIKAETRGWSHKPKLILPQTSNDKTHLHRAAALRMSDAALAASGTIALELAAQGCPAVSVYQANRLSAALAKRLVRVETGNLINILTDSRAVPEFLFERCTADEITPALLELLQKPASQRRALAAAMKALGRGQARMERAAARSVLRFIDGF